MCFWLSRFWPSWFWPHGSPHGSGLKVLASWFWVHNPMAIVLAPQFWLHGSLAVFYGHSSETRLWLSRSHGHCSGFMVLASQFPRQRCWFSRLDRFRGHGSGYMVPASWFRFRGSEMAKLKMEVRQALELLAPERSHRQVAPSHSLDPEGALTCSKFNDLTTEELDARNSRCSFPQSD